MGIAKSKTFQSEIIAGPIIHQSLAPDSKDDGNQNQVPRVNLHFEELQKCGVKIQTELKRFNDSMDLASSERRALHDQSSLLFHQFEELELEMNKNLAQFLQFEEGFANKISSYDEELQDNYRRIAYLEKKVTLNTKRRIFMLNKIAKANGITKAQLEEKLATPLVKTKKRKKRLFTPRVVPRSGTKV